MVAAEMVKQGFGGNLEYGILQILQITDAPYMSAGFRVYENKIAEPEVVHYRLAKVDVQLFGVLIHENGTVRLCQIFVFGFRRLEYYRHERIIFAYVFHQLQTCGRFRRSGFGVTRIGYHPKHVVGIFVIQACRFFEIACERNLRTPSHAQGLLVRIQGFSGKIHALLQYEFIQMRQNGRIKTYRVFHEKDHLNPYFLYIMFKVHFVLD